MRVPCHTPPALAHPPSPSVSSGNVYVKPPSLSYAFHATKGGDRGLGPGPASQRHTTLSGRHGAHGRDTKPTMIRGGLIIVFACLPGIASLCTGVKDSK